MEGRFKGFVGGGDDIVSWSVLASGWRFCPGGDVLKSALL